MLSIDPHSLIKNGKRIDIKGTPLKLYSTLLKLVKKNNMELDMFSIFVAGYFLGTNATLRERYKEIDKDVLYDSRIQNTLWK